MLGEQAATTLELAKLPLLPGALEQLRRGVRSSMHTANVGTHSDVFAAAGLDEDLLQILFDPQTSGGLLIAVPSERASDLLDALRDGVCSRAEIIGEVVSRVPDQAAVRVT